MKRLSLMLALALPAFGAWGNGYSYRATATVQSGKITGSLTNWPGLMFLFNSDMQTVASGGKIQHTCTQTVGSFSLTVPADFIVTSDSAGSVLIPGFEWEQYQTNGLPDLLWVECPTCSVGTSLYLFYGNSSVTTCQGTPSSTWNSNFLSVYHLPDGSTLHAGDSTINANNGTLTNTPTATTGEIDGGGAFAFISLQDIAIGTGLNPAALTYTAWLKGTSFPSLYNAVVARNNGAGIYSAVYVKSTGTLAMYIVAGSALQYDGTGINTLSTGTWYHVVLTYSGATGLIGYVNGAVDGIATGNGALNTTAIATQIGGDPGITRNWNGSLDEIRVVNTVLSAAWIAADYQDQSSPNTFWSITFTQVPATTAAPCTLLLQGVGPC